MITSIDQLDLNARYTYADYLKWQLEEYVELIRGKIFRMAAPSRIHQDISMNFSKIIALYLENSSFKVYAAPFDVRLPHFSEKENKQILTVVQPDICVICDKSKLDKKGCLGAPDLIVEILSLGNSAKEMKDKFNIYEESGVKEYWMIYPDEKSILRYILNDAGKYIGTQPLIESDILTTPILDGLEIKLKDVFRE